MTKKEEQQNIDIATLKVSVGKLEDNVTKILDNHLPHIQAEVSSIRNKLAVWSGIIIGATAILDYVFRIIQ